MSVLGRGGAGEAAFVAGVARRRLPSPARPLPHRQFGLTDSRSRPSTCVKTPPAHLTWTCGTDREGSYRTSRLSHHPRFPRLKNGYARNLGTGCIERAQLNPDRDVRDVRDPDNA